MGRKPEKQNLIAGVVLVIAGMAQTLLTNPVFGIPRPWLALACVVVGVVLVAQYFWLKRNRPLA
jgi:uncharacterized membrane protein HdeD (DUF308 family)